MPVGRERSWKGGIAVLVGALALAHAGTALADGFSAETGAARTETPLTERLTATFDPGPETVTWYFEYGTDPGLADPTVVPLGADNPSHPAPDTIGPGGAQQRTTTTGPLVPHEVYYYRAVAATESAVAQGEVKSFVAGAPNATTDPAGPVTPTSAEVNARVEAQGQRTLVQFQYATDQEYLAGGGSYPQADSATPLLALHGESQVSRVVRELAPGTKYHFRVVATHDACEGTPAEGMLCPFPGVTSYGEDRTFTTPGASTGEASGIGNSEATIAGTVVPAGSSATYHFEYRASASEGEWTSTSEAPVTPADDQPHAVSETLSQLQPGTQYSYRLVATRNGTETLQGATETFTTTSVPSAQTGEADQVTDSSARLNGTANAQNDPGTQYRFQYCDDEDFDADAQTCTNPTTTPPTPLETPNAEDHAISTTLAPGTLQPATTYHVRLIVTNDSGTAEGDYTNFDTTTLPPTVTTLPATAIQDDSATLTGTVDAHGHAATYQFEYGTDADALTESTPEVTVPEGSGPQEVSVQLSGLDPATQYHFRLVADNGVDPPQTGSVESFTTTAPPAPGATTGGHEDVSNTAATVKATIAPNDLLTTYRFEYGTGELDQHAPDPDATVLPADGAEQQVSETLSGLTPGTTYQYRVVASSSAGQTIGATETFTTTSVPSAQTGEADQVTDSSARLNGTANAQNDPGTQYRFQYCDDEDFDADAQTCTNPTTTPPTPLETPNAEDHAISTTLAPGTLQPATTYHVRLIVTNDSGTAEGDYTNFDTTTLPPTVTTLPATATTLPATAIQDDSATLTGTVNPRGLPTVYRFEYGTTRDYDNAAPTTGTWLEFTDDSDHEVSEAVSGLSPNTLYHFRLVATNVSGTSYGEDRTFTTDPAPPEAPPRDPPRTPAPRQPRTPSIPRAPSILSPVSAPLRVWAARTQTLDARGAVSLRVACPAPRTGGCPGAVTLDTSRAPTSARARRRMRLGSARFRAPEGATRVVRVRLNRAGRTLVRRLRVVPVRATVVVTPAGQPRQVLRRTFTVRARRTGVASP